jgi:hypothetical protein
MGRVDGYDGLVLACGACPEMVHMQETRWSLTRSFLLIFQSDTTQELVGWTYRPLGPRDPASDCDGARRLRAGPRRAVPTPVNDPALGTRSLPLCATQCQYYNACVAWSRYTTLDLTPFGYGRYTAGEKMLERNIV